MMHFWTKQIFAFILAISTICDAQFTEQMFSFTSSSDVSSMGVVATDSLNFKKLQELSLCVWVKIFTFRRPSVILSVGPVTEVEDDLSIAMVPRGVLLRQGSTVHEKSFNVMSQTWYLVCLLLDKTSLNIYIDNSVTISQVIESSTILNKPFRIRLGASSNWPDVPPSTVSLPKLTTITPPERLLFGSFVGNLYRPMVWKKTIKMEVLEQLMKCQADILSDKMQWNILNNTSVTASTMNIEETCINKSFDYIIFPNSLNFQDTIELCKKLDLKLIKPSLRLEYDSIFRDVLSFKDICSKNKYLLWLESANYNTECNALTSAGKELTTCSTELCSGCQIIKQKNYFYMKGLCSTNQEDLAFVPVTGLNGSPPYFLGIEKFSIVYQDNKWKLISLENSDLIASMANEIVPIGTKAWILNAPFCGWETGSSVQISFSSCTDNEFSCKSGECILINNRCNSISDCKDGSDEDNCEVIRIPNGLFLKSPPQPIPVKVSLKVVVFKVTSLSSNGRLELVLNVEMSWKDPRIQVANVVPSVDNYITGAKHLWKPKLLFSSSTEVVSLDAMRNSPIQGNRPGIFTATTSGAPLPQTRDSATVDLLYPGENTTFTLSEDIKLTVTCEFDYSYYPFDEHQCDVPIVLVPHSEEHVILNNVNVRYLGPTRHMEMEIPGVDINGDTMDFMGKSHSAAIMEIFFMRRSAWVVISIFMPSLMLMLINNASLWIEAHSCSWMRVFISCIVFVSLLVMWIINFMISEMRGYTRAIDIWLCFCTTHSLLHVMVHTLVGIFSVTRTQNLFSRSSRPGSRSRDIKPMESVSIYDAFMKTAHDVDVDYLWTPNYWIIFIAKIVSFALVFLFNITFWPFVFYYRGKIT